MHNSTHYPIQTAGSAARGGHVPMGCDRCGYEGGVGLAVKAKGQDNTHKDTQARETVLRLYAGRREMALANVLGSTSRAAPILRAVASSTALRFTLRVARDARGPGERAGGESLLPHGPELAYVRHYMHLLASLSGASSACSGYWPVRTPVAYNDPERKRNYGGVRQRTALR